MGAHLIIAIAEDPTPKGLKRANNRAMEEAHREITRMWQMDILPKHFVASAKHVYNHAKRAVSTIKRKLARRQPDIDNVKTGDAKRIALTPRVIRATHRGGEIRIPGPRYFTMNRRGRVHPVSEILTSLPSEDRALEKRGGEKYEAVMNAARDKKTTIIRG